MLNKIIQFFKEIDTIDYVILIIGVTLLALLFIPFSFTMSVASDGISDVSITETSGYSMHPTLEYSDHVVVRETDSIENVDKGDIIIFETDCNVSADQIIHRVVNETDDGLVTKGDNNTRIDQASTVTVTENNGSITITGGSEKCHPYVTDENIVGVYDRQVPDDPVTQAFLEFSKNIG